MVEGVSDESLKDMGCETRKERAERESHYRFHTPDGHPWPCAETRCQLECDKMNRDVPNMRYQHCDWPDCHHAIWIDELDGEGCCENREDNEYYCFEHDWSGGSSSDDE